MADSGGMRKLLTPPDSVRCVGRPRFLLAEDGSCGAARQKKGPRISPLYQVYQFGAITLCANHYRLPFYQLCHFCALAGFANLPPLPMFPPVGLTRFAILRILSFWPTYRFCHFTTLPTLRPGHIYRFYQSCDLAASSTPCWFLPPYRDYHFSARTVLTAPPSLQMLRRGQFYLVCHFCAIAVLANPYGLSRFLPTLPF